MSDANKQQRKDSEMKNWEKTAVALCSIVILTVMVGSAIYHFPPPVKKFDSASLRVVEAGFMIGGREQIMRKFVETDKADTFARTWLDQQKDSIQSLRVCPLFPRGGGVYDDMIPLLDNGACTVYRKGSRLP